MPLFPAPPAPPRAIVGLLLAGLVACGAPGCAGRPATPHAPPVARLTPDQYAPTFDAGVEVLRDAGFVVDRRDFRYGRITTQPKGSPTILEPWVPDNQSTADALRSTLGDLRRTVTLFFDPVPVEVYAPNSPAANDDGRVVIPDPSGKDPQFASPAAYSLRVEVLLERMQVPQRRLNGATQGSVFADLGETPQELRDRGVDGAYWQPIGRDTQLEQRLLDRILAPR